MKASAKASANIAFMKYWGKKNEKLRLPTNSSISMNLSGVFTVTTVNFDIKLKTDLVKIDGKVTGGKERERVVVHLDRIRKLAKLKSFAQVNSKNNFPKGTGIASSASGFAALTLAGVKAANLNLSERELSILARLGSGSACRSIPDGFVEWRKGETSDFSYAYSLYPADYWEILDTIAVVGEKGKKVSSTEGHVLSKSSPFFKARISGMNKKIREIKKALKNKDFTKFGEVTEEEAINMHAIMMTSKPALVYWEPKTLELIQSVFDWRDNGLECYFTIDAGPNVHIICQKKDSEEVQALLRGIRGIKRIIVNLPSDGAKIV